MKRTSIFKNMKKEHLLLIGSISISLFIALGLIRYFAPNLLGIPSDLQMVQVSKEVPAFFHNIFRPEDYKSKSLFYKTHISKELNHSILIWVA